MFGEFGHCRSPRRAEEVPNDTQYLDVGRRHRRHVVKGKYRQIPWLTLRKAVWADLAKRRPSSRKADALIMAIFMDREVYKDYIGGGSSVISIV